MTSLVSMARSLGVVPNSRWHTLAFLAGNGGRSPVYLGVEVDASAMLARRADTAAASIVAQVVAAVGTVWARHPEANSSFTSLGLPFVARHRDVDVKLSFDITVAGTRTVQSAILAAAQNVSATEVTEWIAATRTRLEAGDRGPVRALQFLPGVAAVPPSSWPPCCHGATDRWEPLPSLHWATVRSGTSIQTEAPR